MLRADDTHMLRVLAVWLGILVLLLAHEMGHLTAARLLRLKVRSLTLGVGPRLFALGRLAGAEISVRAFPIAAYVEVANYVDAGDETGEAGYYQSPRWKRAALDLAGPFANYLFAAALVFTLSLRGFFGSDDAPTAWRSLKLAALVPFELARAQARAFTDVVFEGDVRRIMGPYRVAASIAREADRGLLTFASALVVFSVAMAFVNLLPLPGLDGGKPAWNLVDAIRGRASPYRIVASVYSFSLSVLLYLVGFLALAELFGVTFVFLAALFGPVAAGAALRIKRSASERRKKHFVWGAAAIVVFAAVVLGTATRGTAGAISFAILALVAVTYVLLTGWAGYRGAGRFARRAQEGPDFPHEAGPR